jgi:hypothetical protein
MFPTFPPTDHFEEWEGIKRQTQPDGKTCMHTCLAMALGVPVQRVIDKIGSDPFDEMKLHGLLERWGLVWNACVYSRLVFRGWHFACVPSLNIRGGNHCILLWWDPMEGKLVIMDPARGERYAKDGSNLRSWNQLTMFYPGGRIR